MEYLNQGRRERLVRARNHLGESPLHLAAAFAGPTRKGKNIGTTVQVRGRELNFSADAKKMSGGVLRTSRSYLCA